MSITTMLIANRGEIAVRIARTCREMGIATIAVHSSADRGSTVCRMADRSVHIGPSAPRRSYLSVPAVVEAALTCGADAVHPGYGFLSEDPDFAEVCAVNGLVFVGPSPAVMKALGDKSTTRLLMSRAGLPMLPGTLKPVATAGEALDAAAVAGYPVILKAVAGGGGRGMTVVRTPAALPAEFGRTRAAAAAAFGDGRLYLERYLEGARHVEVQVLCDEHGNGVHLGDRDCSTQRRHQKLVEEAPAPNLTDATRAAMGEASVRGALSVGFTGAGTMEYLVDADGGFYLMEMNARLQVEHPVTEMITGIDLVEQQILVAQGDRLTFTQDDVVLRGSAVECRINAEDPDHDFRPNPGELTRVEFPGGPFTRVDTHVHTGYRVPPDYDSLLAKVITWAPDRDRATARMARALSELVIEGPRVATTRAFAARVVDHPLFRAGRHTTDLVDLILSETVATDTVRNGHQQRGTDMKDPSTLSETGLKGLLVGEVGMDGDALDHAPQAMLADLGLDSIAEVELGVVLRAHGGAGELPENAGTLSFGELAVHVCGAGL